MISNRFLATVLSELQNGVMASTVISCVCFSILTNMYLFYYFATSLDGKLRFYSVVNDNHYWCIDACFVLKYSIQRSEFDRCANLAQSGGTFSTAHGANLTLLVRQLLFFYRQNEDSKRLVSTVTYFDLYTCTSCTFRVVFPFKVHFSLHSAVFHLVTITKN